MPNNENPTDAPVENTGDDNDTNELAHSDQDSPGIAAKKARLRAKLRETTASKAKNFDIKAQGTRGGMSASSDLASAKLHADAAQAAMTADRTAGLEGITPPDATATPIGSPRPGDPVSSEGISGKALLTKKIRDALRKAEATGDTATLNRAKAKLRN